jgi:hypothetical protein
MSIAPVGTITVATIQNVSVTTIIYPLVTIVRFYSSDGRIKEQSYNLEPFKSLPFTKGFHEGGTGRVVGLGGVEFVCFYTRRGASDSLTIIFRDYLFLHVLFYRLAKLKKNRIRFAKPSRF